MLKGTDGDHNNMSSSNSTSNTQSWFSKVKIRAEVVNSIVKTQAEVVNSMVKTQAEAVKIGSLKAMKPKWVTPEIEASLDEISASFEALRANTSLFNTANYSFVNNALVLYAYITSPHTEKPAPIEYLADPSQDESFYAKLYHYAAMASHIYTYGEYEKANQNKDKKKEAASSSNELKASYFQGVAERNILTKHVQVAPFSPDVQWIPGFVVAIDHITKTICVIIKGTSSIADIATDLHAKPTPWMGGEVHAGILRSARAIIPLIDQSINNGVARTGFNDVSFVGHSLGGGVATVLSMCYMTETSRQQSGCALPVNTRVTCYAFAPPPVWFSPKPDYHYAANIHVIIHHHDCVPRASLRRVEKLGLMASEVDALKILSDARRWEIGVTGKMEKHECDAVAHAIETGMRKPVSFEMAKDFQIVGTVSYLKRDQDKNYKLHRMPATETKDWGIIEGKTAFADHKMHAYLSALHKI